METSLINSRVNYGQTVCLCRALDWRPDERDYYVILEYLNGEKRGYFVTAKLGEISKTYTRPVVLIKNVPENRRLQCIKVLREHTGALLGLREAKELIFNTPSKIGLLPTFVEPLSFLAIERMISDLRDNGAVAEVYDADDIPSSVYGSAT